MRSLLRDVCEQLRCAPTEIVFVWLAFLGFMIGGCAARGDESCESKARAALALARAKRDRETTCCFVDYETAVAAARRADKHLVLWVGMKCTDDPQLRRELADVVHCHVPSQHGDRSPRVVIEGADGIEWFVPAEKIGPETARKLRAKWRGAKTPLLRRDVGISETE